jgi:protein-tyrosine-phosphatase
MEKKIRVLFICQHNSGRSQIAEAYLRELYGDHFHIESKEIKAPSGAHGIGFLKAVRIFSHGLFYDVRQSQRIFYPIWTTSSSKVRVSPARG